MTVQGSDFATATFQDVTWLMKEAGVLYERIVSAHGRSKGCVPLTAEQIIRERKWEASLPLTAHNFASVLQELKIFYVPKVMQPGPCIVFPQRDIFGNYTRARIRPQYELLLKDGPAKYGALGTKHEWKGPSWFGNSIENTERLLTLRYVVLVEGPFDMLALRLLFPGMPVLTSGTKTVSPKHLDYLEMLGVEELVLMFDQDESKLPGQLGAGQAAMNNLAAQVKLTNRFRVAVPPCPANDPSRCLEDYRLARALKNTFSAYPQAS